MCTKIFIVCMQYNGNVYKNSAVDLWIECYTVALHIKEGAHFTRIPFKLLTI